MSADELGNYSRMREADVEALRREVYHLRKKIAALRAEIRRLQEKTGKIVSIGKVKHAK